MGETPFQRVEELFHQAADLPPAERQTFLDERCEGDTVLRAAVEGLLRHDASEEPTRAYLPSPDSKSLPEPAFAELPELPGYQIIERIGMGGMGVVYKARQVNLRRLVAIKMLHAAAPATPEVVARFRVEAEAMARLAHPNIVQIYEVGDCQGRPYFAMEYIAGGGLGQRLDGVPWQPDPAAELVEILARAIHFAHEQGIVHRDLKPPNVLLKEQPPRDATPGQGPGPRGPDARSGTCFMRAGAALEPKITDFGIAKDTTAIEQLTATGQVMGTPSYMAPEQAEARRHIGPATDIYALGVILYQLLTGRPPFQGTTPLDTLTRVVSEEPLPPRRLQPRLPRDLETVCLKCLEKDPRKRYENARELAEDLRRYQAREPTRARPVGIAGRTWRWCRRRPLVAALLSIAVVLALMLIATALVYNARLQQALAQTNEDLVELNVTLGMTQAEEDNAIAGLLWFSRALEIDDRPSQESKHRTRIAMLLRQCPDLEGLLAADEMVLATHVGTSTALAAVSTPDRVVRVRDVKSAETVGAALHQDSPSVAAVFDRDGTVLATARADGVVQVWEVPTGRLHWATGQGGMVRQVVFAPGGLVLVIRADFTVQQYEARTGKAVTLPGTTPSPRAFSTASPDGSRLFAAMSDGSAEVWDVMQQRRIGERWRPAQPVADAVFSADGRRLAVAGKDAVSVRDLVAGRDIGKPIKRSRPLRLIALSPDGSRLLSAWNEHTACVWHVDSGELITTLDHGSQVRHATFSPDGNLVVTAGANNQARLWDTATGELFTTPLLHNGSVRTVTFDARGERILTVGNDHAARLWRLPAFRAPRAESVVAPARDDKPHSADGRRQLRLLGATAQVIDAQTGAMVGAPLRHASTIRYAAFSPDGRLVATASDDNTAQVWDANTGERRLSPLAHKTTVHLVGFSPDGRLIVTASEDRSARVWDAATGESLTPPLRHPHVVVRATFDAAGQQLTTITSTGSTYTWSLKPDDRPRQVLSLLAQVLSGSYIDDSEEPRALEPEALQAAWRRLRSLQP
jgi:serine/threonine protein kinase/WD40 repeat protein